jgi:carbon starvation protein
MNSLFVILISIVCFIIAYVTYGAWLAKQWGVDPNRKTPAHTRNDGVDYVPAKAPIRNWLLKKN